MEPIQFAQAPLGARPPNRTSYAARCGHAESALVCVRSHEKNHHVSSGNPDASLVHLLKIGPAFQPKMRSVYCAVQAAIRRRPLRRRARSTLRPPRVRIRTRKPWVFLRLRLLG